MPYAGAAEPPGLHVLQQHGRKIHKYVQHKYVAAADHSSYLMRPSSWLRTPRVSSMMAELSPHTPWLILRGLSVDKADKKVEAEHMQLSCTLCTCTCRRCPASP